MPPNHVKEGHMIINHNMSALYADRQVKFNELDLNKDIEKLSTGMRINRGGDDASGLAVSEKLRSQVRGLNQRAGILKTRCPSSRPPKAICLRRKISCTGFESWLFSQQTASTQMRTGCRFRSRSRS